MTQPSHDPYITQVSCAMATTSNIRLVAQIMAIPTHTKSNVLAIIGPWAQFDYGFINYQSDNYTV